MTGGSRGIGSAVCLELAKGGARVAVNYISKRDTAKETVQTIIQDGGEAYAFKADVSDPEEVQKMVAETEKTFGPIDLLVTSAGIVRRENHETLSFEIWKEIICLLYTSPSPRDAHESRMPSSA